MNVTPLSSIVRTLVRRTAAVAALLAVASPLAASQPAVTEVAEDAREAASRAAESIQDYQQESTDLAKANVRAAFAELDAEIVRLEAATTDASDQTQRQAAEARLAALKDRRDELRRDFNQSRFDELKADLRREWAEFKGWVRAKTDPVEAGAEREVSRAESRVRDTGNYVRTPESGGAPVAVNRDAALSATEKEQRKLALARVNQELELLEERAEKLDAPMKEQLEARMELLQDRRDELKKNFNDNRYTALVKDIRSELEQARAAAE